MRGQWVQLRGVWQELRTIQPYPQLVESLLGRRMAKEHSAVDWSTRPLPEPWLEYAALDVEVLVELLESHSPDATLHRSRLAQLP